MSRYLASLHGVLAGASSPASTVLSGHYDFLPPFPPHFVAFAWRYHGSCRLVSSLPTPPTAERRAWGSVTRYPRPGCLPRRRQDLPSSWGTPMPVCTCSQTPVGQLVSDHSQDGCTAPAERTTKAPTKTRLSRLHSMASRLAAYVSPAGYPTDGARLASGCWSGSPGRASHPQGPCERFPVYLMLAVLLSQASWHNRLFVSSWLPWQGGSAREPARDDGRPQRYWAFGATLFARRCFGGGAAVRLHTSCRDRRPPGARPRTPNPLNPRGLCVRMASTGGGVVGQRVVLLAF